MRAQPVVWILRAAWLTLPFTLGDALGHAVDHRSAAVAAVTAALAWSSWAAVLVASMVLHPVALTMVRMIVPAAPVAAVIAAVAADGDAATSATSATSVVGLVTALVAVVAALSGALSDDFVNGASYGDERRFALRTPASFLLGPVPIFWIATAGGLTTGPLLLAARQWIPGAALTLLGVGLARPAALAFHGLSRRWLVFVPAGITLIDHLGIVDPVLLPAKKVVRLGPAFADSTATDLTQNAMGLALEISLDSPVEITRRTARSEGEIQLLQSVLISPCRPGAVVTEATRRKLRTDAAAVR